MWINEVNNLLEDTENPLALQMGGKLMDLSHADGKQTTKTNNTIKLTLQPTAV